MTPKWPAPKFSVPKRQGAQTVLDRIVTPSKSRVVRVLMNIIWISLDPVCDQVGQCLLQSTQPIVVPQFLPSNPNFRCTACLRIYTSCGSEPKMVSQCQSDFPILDGRFAAEFRIFYYMINKIGRNEEIIKDLRKESLWYIRNAQAHKFNILDSTDTRNHPFTRLAYYIQFVVFSIRAYAFVHTLHVMCVQVTILSIKSVHCPCIATFSVKWV